MKKVSEENARRLYEGSAGFMRMIRLSIVIIFLMLIWDITRSATTGNSFLGAWFIPAMILLIIAPATIHIFKTRKLK
jgi:hypothetical protein